MTVHDSSDDPCCVGLTNHQAFVLRVMDLREENAQIKRLLDALDDIGRSRDSWRLVAIVGWVLFFLMSVLFVVFFWNIF